MSVESLNESGITTKVSTSIVLQMADHTCTNPLGELTQASTTIVGK